MLAGAGLFIANTGTDAQGFTQSEICQVREDTYAFVLWVRSSNFPSYLTWMSAEDIGQAMWIVTPVDSSKELFVGWADAIDGEDYLGNQIMYSTPSVWHRNVASYTAELEFEPSVTYNQGAPTVSPGQEAFWVESGQSSSAPLTVQWDAYWEDKDDRQMLIIMNADGSKNVAADVQLAFNVPIYSWLPFLLIPLGIVLCLVGVLIIKRKLTKQ